MLKRSFWSVTVAVGLLLVGPAVVAVTERVPIEGDWASASRAAVGIAPDPQANPEAIVQVYGARAFEWRAAFAVHTWIAAKPAGAEAFTTYQVIGWNVRGGGDAVSVSEGAPDRLWYGARPCILAEIRGENAARAIPHIRAAAAAYPYRKTYRSWPGPNSNTFTAYVLRRVPEIRADLPPTAIGKDYLGVSRFVAAAPSGHGVQMSLFGALGILASPVEGFEVNLLGLSAGVDTDPWALRVPGLARVGGGTPAPGYCD